jgi:hypothetical protein
MNKDTVVRPQQPEHERDPLSAMLRGGAHGLIADALQAQFEEFLPKARSRTEEAIRQPVRFGE